MNSRRAADVPLDKGFEVLDQLKAAGILQLNYFGGEPTFYRGIKDPVRYGRELGFYSSMVTNGRLLTPELADSLVLYVNAFAVSLHGMPSYNNKITRRRGAFEDTLGKLKTLREHTDKITINMTVTDNDVDQIESLIELVYLETGIKTFALNRCIGQPPELLPLGFDREDLSLSRETSSEA